MPKNQQKVLFQVLYVVVFLLLGVGGARLFFSSSARTAPQREKLQFVCLAWQEHALETYKSLVAEWNQLHTESQVEYVQGTWSSIHDYLITGFETGDVPDVIHYESSAIIDFAVRGYLEDLSPLISDDLRNDVQDVAWASVRRPNGSLSGVPILLESLIILYNRDLFRDVGIVPPDMNHPWTWDDLRTAARALTRDTNGDGSVDRWGAGMGLRNSSNIVLNLTIGFGGSYFRREHGSYFVRIGDDETKLLSLLMDMMYKDSSMTTAGLGQSGPGMIPSFFAGKYAMLVGIGAWARQQLVQNAPAGFRWGVLPPVMARTQQIGTSTQTLSIPKASLRKQEAMAFIEFLANRQNDARIASSDWMVPARTSCLQMPQFQTAGDGWDIASESAKYLAVGDWVGAPGYIEWKSRVANPVLQELFSNRLTVMEAARRIEIESNTILSRYQSKDKRW
jgi:multiple sugar transport system substrate-binding protein